ncbi:hypothetical protein Hanom_Chr15g01343381 [Helianthus anomalus]
MRTNMKFFLVFYMLLINYNNNVTAMSPVSLCTLEGINNTRPVHVVDYAPNLCSDDECNSECIHMVPWSLRLVSYSCQWTICICCGTEEDGPIWVSGVARDTPQLSWRIVVFMFIIVLFIGDTGYT